MLFRYLSLTCMVCMTFVQAENRAAADDTVTVYVVYTWKSASQKEKYNPEEASVHESKEEADQAGRKMVADRRAYDFVVRAVQRKLSRKYKSNRSIAEPSADYSGGYGSTIVQPSPGNLKPQSPPQEPEKAPIKKPDLPFVIPEPYNPPVDIVGSWAGTYRSSKGVPFNTTLRFAADGRVTSTTPSGKGGRGTWRRTGNTVQITWRSGASTTWTVRGNQLSMSNVESGFSESAQLVRQ